MLHHTYVYIVYVIYCTMIFKTNLKKIGTSHHTLIPSSIIQVYDLLKYTDKYEYVITVENEGKRLILNRVKKKDSEKQTTLSKFKKVDDDKKQKDI